MSAAPGLKRALSCCAFLACVVSGRTPASATPSDASLRNLASQVDAARLMSRIERLQAFGTRSSYRPESAAAADWIAGQLRDWGYEVTLEPVPWPGQPHPWHNVIATRRGTTSPEKVYVLGAHYDSQAGHRFKPEAVAPGADDNASGMAGVLEAAEILRSASFGSTVQFIAFAGEEQMLRGSLIHVKHLRSDTSSSVQAALIFEMIGYTGPTQKPVPACPPPPASGGNFLGALANKSSQPLLDRYLATTGRLVPELPLASCVNGLVARSDHFPFWMAKLPALMLTDTANYRNPNYHKPTDTLDTINPAFAAAATRSALVFLAELAGLEPGPAALPAPHGAWLILGAALSAALAFRLCRRVAA
jgi:Zn-dependent M28 family amino/carboxypeptidase